MKIFTKKSFIKKMAILCLFLILFNCSGINQVQAANDDSDWGGKLLASTISLFVALADSAYSLANKYIMGDHYGDALLEIRTTTSFWGWVAKGFLLIIRSSSRNIDRVINSRSISSRSYIPCRKVGRFNSRWKRITKWR
ncbi:MAG: hypothetical protein HFJ48_06210 [Clostridia bacterium]|nr:hypothetical protein [Clostridia bacterium]